MVIDHRMTASAELAHYVLPPRLELERADVRDLLDVVASRHHCDRIVDLLRTFPPQDQRLLMMLHVEECSVDEIARACGGSEKTVYTRAHRIRAQVRERVAAARAAA